MTYADNGPQNKEVLRRWINELRSGEYKQATGALRKTNVNAATGEKENTFCCLGVLTDMWIREHPDLSGQWDFCNSGDEIADMEEEGADTLPSTKRWHFVQNSFTDIVEEANFLPPVVMKWAGFHTNSPIGYMGERTSGSTADNLAEYNDAGVDFNEIADIIESTYLRAPYKH